MHAILYKQNVQHSTSKLGKLKPGHTGEHEGVSLLYGESKDPSACYVHGALF